MQQITFNPSFRSQVQIQPNEQPKEVVVRVGEPDSFSKQSNGMKEDIGKIAKFFTTLSEMTKATIKAVGYGAATAGTFLAGSWLFGALPKGFKKGNSLWNTIKHPLKSISTKAKVITGLATAVVAGYHLVKGKLTANQRTANVDHQLNIGHRAN